MYQTPQMELNDDQEGLLRVRLVLSKQEPRRLLLT